MEERVRSAAAVGAPSLFKPTVALAPEGGAVKRVLRPSKLLETPLSRTDARVVRLEREPSSRSAAVTDFRARYGPYAVIAGASEGLGAAFATTLASRGLHLVLLARRAPVLAALAERLQADHGIRVVPLSCDIADPQFADALRAATEALDVGLAVFNAAYAYTAPLLSRPIEDTLRVVDVNCRGPLLFAHALAPKMVTRGRGGLVLMSSLAGNQGTPRLAVYAASKAFNTVLGESLWRELAPMGIDVVVSCAGAIRTPGYLRTASGEAPGTLDPEQVATQTLDALGHGPVVIPGATNKLAAFVLRRILPRTQAVKIMARSTAGLT